MSASLTDKITDVRNGARPNSARVTTARTIGGANLACNDLSGWPTASKVHFVTYQLDTNSNPVASSQLDCYGIVSSNTITSLVVADGIDGGNSVGDVVEMLPTAKWAQDLADALITTLERNGALKEDVVGSTNIADNAILTAHILDDAVTAPKLSGIAKDNLTTDSNPYKFSVTRNAAWTSGNNVYAKCSFDTEDYDTNSNFSGGTYTAPANGFYQFNWGVGANVTAGGLYSSMLFKNSSALKAGTTAVQGAASTIVVSVGATIIQLTTGDTIDIYFYGTGGSGFTGSNCHFSGFLESRT